MPEVADLIEEVGYQLSVEVEDRTRRELLKAYGRGADMLAYETTGKTGPVSLGGTVPRQVQRHIDEIVAPIADWNESLAKKIGDMVRQKAVREDLSPGEVAQFIRDELPRHLGSEKVTIQRPGKRPFTTTPDQYTEMIARTLPAAIRNEAYLDEAEKAGIYESWTWVAMGDERMCPVCGQRHGKTYGFDAPRPPGHPNCLHPETKVFAPGGVVAVTRSRYSGPIMELTFESGSRLTVTPNHLLLSPDGFAAAKLLREGDYVQGCPDFQRVVSVHPDDDRDHPTIEEIFDAIRVTGGGSTMSVPVAAEYFHGDAKFIQENIDVVGADCLLRRGSEPETVEHPAEDGLGLRNPSAEAEFGAGDFAAVLKRLAAATDGLVGGLRQSSPLFGGRLAHPEVHRLAPVERDDPHLDEPAGYGVSRHSEMIRECRDRLAGRMKPDKLVNINIRPYHGYVYDLESISSLIIANGMIVSNCRCRSLLNLAEDAEKPAGAPTPDQIAQVRARQDALDESYAAAVALSEERARLLEAAAGQSLKGADAKKLHQLESAIAKQRREAAKVQTEIYRIKANMPKTVPEKKVEATLRDRANHAPVALRGLGPTQATNAGAVVSSYAHDYPAFTRDAFGGITSATAWGDGTFRTELRKEIEAEMSRRGADPDWSSYYAEKRSTELLEGLPGPEGEWRVRSVALGDGSWVMVGNDAELSSPALTSVLAQDVRDGRLQWGAESPIAMWEAEFGRAAVGHLGLTAPGSEIDTLYQSMSSAEIADAVGSAAAGDPDSFAAACWAEFRSSPDPRPVSMAVGRHIEENLQLYEKGHKAPVETARSRLVPSGTPLKGEVPTPPTVPQETKERLLAAQYDIEDEVKKIQDWNHLASLIQVEGNLVSSQIQWYRDSQAAAKAAYPAAIRLRDEIVACKNQYKEAGLPLPSGLPFKDYAIQGIPIPSKLDIDALIAAAAAKIKKEWEYSQSQVKKDLDAVIEYNAKISGLMETAGVGELIEMAEKAATHLEDARNRRDSMEYDSADYQKLTGTPLALKIQDPNNVELRETVDSIKAHFKKGTPPGEKIDLEQLDRRVAEFNDTQKIMTSLIETANEFNAAVYDLLRNFKHNRDYLEYRFRTARNGLTAAVRHYGELTQIDAKIVELGGVSRIKEVPNPAKITLVLEEEDLARFFEAQADAEPVVAGADNEQAEMDYLARLEDYLRQRETVDRYNAEARAVLSDPSSNLNDLLVRWEEADRALRRARSLYVFLVDRREELDIAGTLPWDPFETRLSPGDYEIRSVWSDRQSGSSEPGPRIDPVIRRRFEHEIETIREGYETVDKFNAEIDSFIETGMGINDLKRLHAEVYSDWKEADYHREKAISIANEIVSFGWPSVHNEIPERNPGPKYTVAEIIEMVLDAQAATTMKGGARAWAATLTGEERSNISSYTATYYSTINRKCREGTWRGDPAIASIDSALSKGSLSEQTVYRGIRADPDRMHQYKAAVGTTVPERAYVSTSRSKDIASGFVGAEHGEAIIFEIRVPDGTPGAYIAPLSNLVEEDEVLLMRGGGIKIQSATEDANGALWVKCEFVPPDLRAGGAGAELASLRSDIIEAVRELKKYSDFAVNPPPEMLYRLNLGNLGAKTEEAMRTRSKAANLLIQHNDMVKNLKEAGIIVDPPPDGFPAFPQDIPTVFEVNWQVRCEERAHPLITTFEGELVQLKKAVEYVEEFNSSIRDHISVPFDLNEILYWRSAAADKISEANDLYSGLNDLSVQVMRISGKDLAMPTDPAKLQIEISEAEIRAAFDALSSPSKTPEASQKDWSEWAETLSEEELDAIRDYSADSYYDLNAWLRAGKDPAGTVFEDLVDRLDHVVESGVLRAQTVYRGIPANSNVIESYVRSVGVIVPDSGFMSTSCSNLDAELFTNEKGLILEIQVPDGAPGAAIGPLSVGDTEILMPRGTNLRILSADLVEGLWHVKSEVVI